ncbi:MAG: tetratricopeptide repeat protein [Candidatus Heimdallarchaeota archaeon]
MLSTLQGNEELVAEREATLKYIAGKAYRRKGDLEQASALLQASLSIRQTSGNSYAAADPLNDIGIIFAIKGEFKLALNYLQQSLELFEEVGNKSSVVKLRNNIGRIYSQIGKLDQALKHFQESLEVSEELGNKRITAGLLLNIGLTNWAQGDLDSALEFYQRSLALYEELESKNEMAICLNNIGLAYATKGELAKVLEIYQRSLAIRKELGDKHGIASSLNNIGQVYRIMEDFETSLTYFENSLELFEEIGNDVDTSTAIYNLILATMRARDIEDTQTLLQRLEEMNAKKENKLISQCYRLSKAIILATSTRIKDKARAQELLEEISEEEIIQHDKIMDAMLQLTELLLFELKVAGDPIILKEINALTHRLVDIAQDQNNFFLLAETYMLQSKTALLELDVKHAQQLLNQAQLLAEEKGLPKLAMRISGEYDSLLDQMKKWDDYVDRDASMSERLELARLEDMVVRMIRKRETDIPDRAPEDPMMVMILAGSGLTLYSKAFVEEILADEHLVGGFLTAVGSLGSEIFASSGAIERIMYQDYTLALKPLESLSFVYVFKGQSYSALLKLDQFMQATYDSPIVWGALERTLKTGLTLDEAEEKTMEETIRQIFQMAAI